MCVKLEPKRELKRGVFAQESEEGHTFRKKRLNMWGEGKLLPPETAIVMERDLLKWKTSAVHVGPSMQLGTLKNQGFRLCEEAPHVVEAFSFILLLSIRRQWDYPLSEHLIRTYFRLFYRYPTAVFRWPTDYYEGFFVHFFLREKTCILSWRTKC